jgi:hypothetical protein
MRALIYVAVGILVLWFVLSFIIRVTTGLIHLLVIVALVLFIIGMLRNLGGTRSRP